MVDLSRLNVLIGLPEVLYDKVDELEAILVGNIFEDNTTIFNLEQLENLGYYGDVNCSTILAVINERESR